jgi:hypothetical protein
MYNKVENEENKNHCLKLDTSKSTIFFPMFNQQNYTNNIIKIPKRTLVKYYVFMSLFLFIQIILLFFSFKNRLFLFIEILIIELLSFTLYSIQVGFHFSINKTNKQFSFAPINLIPFSYYFLQNKYSFETIESFKFTIGVDCCKLYIILKEKKKIIECFYMNEIYIRQNEENLNNINSFYYELLLISHYLNYLINEENSVAANINEKFYNILQRDFCLSNEFNENNKLVN